MTLASGNWRHKKNAAAAGNRPVSQRIVEERPMESLPNAIREWEVSDRHTTYLTGWWRYLRFNKRRMNKILRSNQILGYLEDRNRASTSQIANALHLERGTVYKYCRDMEKEDYVSRIIIRGTGRRHNTLIAYCSIIEGEEKHIDECVEKEKVLQTQRS